MKGILMVDSTPSSSENEVSSIFDDLIAYMEKEGSSAQAARSLFAYGKTEEELEKSFGKYRQQLVLTPAEFNIVKSLSDTQKTSSMTKLKLDLSKIIELYLHKEYSEKYSQATESEKTEMLDIFKDLFTFADTSGKSEVDALDLLQHAFSEDNVTNFFNEHENISAAIQQQIRQLANIINQRVQQGLDSEEEEASKEEVLKTFLDKYFIPFKDVVNQLMSKDFEYAKAMVDNLSMTLQKRLVLVNKEYHDATAKLIAEQALITPLLALSLIAKNTLSEKDKKVVSAMINQYPHEINLQIFRVKISRIIRSRVKNISKTKLQALWCLDSGALPSFKQMQDRIVKQLSDNPQKSQQELKERFGKLRATKEHENSQDLEVLYVHRDLLKAFQEFNFPEKLNLTLTNYFGDDVLSPQALVDLMAKIALNKLLPVSANLQHQSITALITDSLQDEGQDEVMSFVAMGKSKKRGLREKVRRYHSSSSSSSSSQSSSSSGTSSSDSHRVFSLSRSLDVPKGPSSEVVPSIGSSGVGFFSSSLQHLPITPTSSSNKLKVRPPTPSTIRRTSSRDNDTLSSSSPRYKQSITPGRSRSNPAECSTPRGHGDWPEQEETQLPEIPVFTL